MQARRARRALFVEVRSRAARREPKSDDNGPRPPSRSRAGIQCVLARLPSSNVNRQGCTYTGQSTTPHAPELGSPASLAKSTWQQSTLPRHGFRPWSSRPWDTHRVSICTRTVARVALLMSPGSPRRCLSWSSSRLPQRNWRTGLLLSPRFRIDRSGATVSVHLGAARPEGASICSSRKSVSQGHECPEELGCCDTSAPRHQCTLAHPRRMAEQADVRAPLAG